MDESNVFRTSTVHEHAKLDRAEEPHAMVVFFCNLNYLGEASFPWQGTQEYPHYVQISLAALYGNNNADTFYNQGKTLVHEVGHWLGLLHTFPNTPGCSDSGDFVLDTPAMRNPAKGCHHGLDSCPNHQGFDPIQNYMGYSDDSCMSEFTRGQVGVHACFQTPYPFPPQSPCIVEGSVLFAVLGCYRSKHMKASIKSALRSTSCEQLHFPIGLHPQASFAPIKEATFSARHVPSVEQDPSKSKKHIVDA